MLYPLFFARFVYIVLSCVLDVLVFFFFFSSRRRHTRCLSDWSSDVCSSDLDASREIAALPSPRAVARRPEVRQKQIGKGRRQDLVDLLEPASSCELQKDFGQIGRASCRERV